MVRIASSQQRGWAYETAMAVREAFAFHAVASDEDLAGALDAFGLQVVERALPADQTEILDGNTLYVRAGLDRARRRWAISHGLAHHLRHAGNQLKLPPSLLGPQERQADLFAGFLLLSPSLVKSAHAVYDLAETACVPLERVVQFLGWLAA